MGRFTAEGSQQQLCQVVFLRFSPSEGAFFADNRSSALANWKEFPCPWRFLPSNEFLTELAELPKFQQLTAKLRRGYCASFIL